MNIDILQDAYPLSVPNTTSTINGMAWTKHPVKEDTFVTIAWQNYSSGTGEYRGVSADWFIDMETETLYLQHVSIKRPCSPWNDFLTNPSGFVTPRHRRLARMIAAKELGKGKLRLSTKYFPKE